METDWKALVNQLLRSQPHIGLAALAGRKMIEPLMEGAQLTKDVYKGDVDLQDPATTARAMAAGPTAMSGTMPLAKAAGADLGVFGGRIGAENLSKAGHTRPHNNMMRAEMLDKEIGTPDEIIHKETGWHKDPLDKTRKFEIDDSPAKMKLDRNVWNSSNVNEEGTLGEYLDHPELYKAYPDIANIPVQIKKGRYGGLAWNKASHGMDRIEATGATPEELQSVLLHEVQHIIQGRERFQGGINHHVEPKKIKEMASAHKQALRNERERLGRENPKDWGESDALEKRLAWVERNLKDMEKVENTWDYDIYRHSPEEVEASNVQLRQDWDAMARRMMYPPETGRDAARNYRR